MSAWLAVLLAGLQAGVIDLVPGEDPADPLTSAYVMVDETARLDLAEVRQRRHRFVRNASGFINPGTTSGVVWVRFDVRNRGDSTGAWVLSLNRALVDPGEIYLVTGDRARTLLADSDAAYAESYAEFGTLAARFELAPDTGGSLYLRYRGGNWSGLAPILGTEATLRQSVTWDLVVVFALIGGVLTLVLYASVSFLLLDRRSVYLYAVAQIALLGFYVHLCGFTTVYLWPEHPDAGRVMAPLTMAVYIAAMLQFARHFFDTRAHLPALDAALRVLLAAALGAMLLLPLDYLIPAFPRTLPLYLVYLATPLVWLTLAPLALEATFIRDRDFWPLAVSWSLMAAFMLALTLVWTGIVDAMPLHEHVYGVVVYVEAVFMALGIALRIRRMRRQRIEAERRLSRSLAAELSATQRAVRLAEEREWALGDLAEKGRLILAAGHDTRQMISSLRHYALGLERHGSDARTTRAGRELEQIAGSLDEVLTTAINGSSSGGIGDRALALEAFSPAQVVTPLQLIYGSMAAAKGIELRLRSTSKLLVTDRVLLARVLSNLVSNALKYTDAGKVLVACRATARGHRFQVLDTGHGLRQGALDSLLNAGTGAVRFESASHGHGAGLHIVKSLTSRLGGELLARSVPGRGSLFELRLERPAAPPGAAEPRHIVVADTDDEQHARLEEAGRQLGMAVLRAADGREAETLLAERRALMLVDEHFGGTLAGLDLARTLAGSGRARGSTVAVTSYDRSVEARMRMVKACPLILYKPLTAALLRAAVSSGNGG